MRKLLARFRHSRASGNPVGANIPAFAGMTVSLIFKAIQIIVNKLKHCWQVIKTGSISAWDYSKINFIDLKDKIKREQKKRRLRKLPWYLVLGAPQAGKKYIVKNSGLMFVKPDYLGEEAVNYIKQFPDFDWWFSEQAIMIDSLNYNHETDIAAWKKFVKLLKRERRNKPLNGIILVVNICDLLRYSNKERQNFVHEICAYIRDIHDSFKTIVPIYIVFNKCDLIEGFMEFFDALSKEELSQVWGMTLPLQESGELKFVQEFFNREYSVLIEQLRKRVLWAFDAERSMRGRELISAFPQQMQLFKKPIDNFIAEIFSAVRYPNAVQIRGLYFTSCIQGEGKTYDFLLQAMSRKFQLVPPSFARPPRIGESYFIRSLFFAVILPEAPLLGDSERRKKSRKILYQSTLIACPLIIFLSGIGMYYGRVENDNNIRQISQYLDYYENSISVLKPGDDSLTTVLPALDQIDQSYSLYIDNDYWGLKFLIISHIIKSDIYGALQRALHTMFMPRIAAQLENSLNKNIQNQNLLYATLKGYLVFNASSFTSQYSIKAPIEYKWNTKFIHKPELIGKLRYYLNTALKKAVEKLPLDQNLINRTRGQLEQVIPFQRAYGLLELRANVSNIPDLVFRSSIGPNFDKIFRASGSGLKISAFYTQQGYNEIFLPQYKSIADEVAQDNRDIGLSDEAQKNETSSKLKSDLRRAYNQHYIAAWHKALGRIKIKPFANLRNAVNVLNLLASQRSPISRILNLIYADTYNIRDFTQINNYNNRTINSAVTKLRDYMEKLEQAPDQNQACFTAAKDTKPNPVQQLTVTAQHAPQPLQRWLRSLADNCQQIIVQGAYDYMNSAWHNNVMRVYNQSINGRYPLNPRGYSDIALADFNKFYGNNGILDQYFNDYIKPFTNTHTIKLPQHTINIFVWAKKIRDEFSPFTITIKPITLDSRLASIKIIIGPKELIYSHGPQHISTISWPLPATQDEARAIITDFNNEQYVASGSGPWSLFKLFSSGSFKQINFGTYLFYIHLHGFSAGYRITGPGDINLFRLTDLKNFRLPNNIVTKSPSSPRRRGSTKVRANNYSPLRDSRFRGNDEKWE